MTVLRLSRLRAVLSNQCDHGCDWVRQADGLAGAVRALQEKLVRLEGDDLAAASDQEALATSLATVLSRCDHPPSG